MKSYLNILSLALLFSLIFCSSCGDTDINSPEEENCIFKSENVIVEPICSFNPKVATTVPFPIRALLNGVQIPIEDYEMRWSHDLNFGGSSISATYEQLPISVSIKEYASDCVATATLEKAYWD